MMVLPYADYASLRIDPKATATITATASTATSGQPLDGLFLAASATVCHIDFDRLAFGSKRPTNCPNCGAPAKQCECEYCGTHLW